MSEKLKPCPFCGKMPEVEPNGDCYCDYYICPMAPDSYMPKDWNTRPIEDALSKRIAELEATVEVGADIAKAYENRVSEIVALSNETVGKLNFRIAELEAEIDQLTAHDATERQDDKCSKPEPNVCEACGGDGTVLLRDGYEGQVIATAECIYCNGTGRVSKERE